MKRKILFIGSFQKAAKDGSVGGQMFACRSLINSKLSEKIDWILLDTTGESVPSPSLPKRGWNAIIRIITLLQKLVFSRKFKTILIFCGDSWSFREKGMMLLLGKLFRKKVIIAPRSGMILQDIEKPRFRKFISHVFDKADIVLCQSSKWKDVFLTTKNMDGIDGKWKDHFVVRQNWIDVEAYIQNRPTYETKGNKVVFLYLGWMEAYKGIGDLMEAIGMIRDRITDKVHFLIAGNGSEMQPIQKLSGELGIEQLVEFIGWADRSKKMELLRMADAYILPSHFEGLPNALLEAMASALPCIATKVGAVEDVIENGINGILIEPKQPSQIADAILEIAKNDELRIRLSRNARNSVIANNSIDAALVTFNEILL